MEQEVRLWVYALACFSFIELILIAVADNARQKMKLTAESAIMRNDELSQQLAQCRALGEERIKTLEAYEKQVAELKKDANGRVSRDAKGRFVSEKVKN